MSGDDGRSLLAEGYNFALFPKPILPSNFSHAGECLEEKPWRIGSANARTLATHDKHPTAKLPCGQFFDKDGDATRDRLTHLRTLSIGGFGTAHRGQIFTHVNGSLA
jgi:hypothetical protein